MTSPWPHPLAYCIWLIATCAVAQVLAPPSALDPSASRQDFRRVRFRLDEFDVESSAAEQSFVERSLEPSAIQPLTVASIQNSPTSYDPELVAPLPDPTRSVPSDSPGLTWNSNAGPIASVITQPSHSDPMPPADGSSGTTSFAPAIREFDQDVLQIEHNDRTNSLAQSTTNQRDSDCCLPRIWARAEYVLWFPEGANVPALVTTSPVGTPQEQAARTSSPSTSILFGNDELHGGSRSGARFSLGGWLNQCNMFGIELNFLVLGNEETTFSATNEFEILGRPFFNVLNAQQDSKLINFPGLTAGRIDASMQSSFYTGEALLRKRTAGWGASQLDWYLGYRTARLVDDLRILEAATVLSGPVTGAQLVLSDQFRTRNTFHGVDLGLRLGALVQPLLEVELSAMVAVGTTYSETQIVGSSRTNAGGSTTTSDFGFLAQSTNAGDFESDTFSTITEFGVSGKRMFRPGLSLTVGYTLFFWHDIQRSGDLIDTSINTSQFPPGALNGEPRPSAGNKLTNFWAHGFQIGFEYLF